MRSEGYSQDVIRQLSLSRAQSTNSTYDSKWKLFDQFCRDRNRDPELADSPLLADFLLYLFQVRGLKPSTIAGYRAAIGQVLRLSSPYDPRCDDKLTLLVKSFERMRPPSVNSVPSWDIGLVLSALLHLECSSIPVLSAKAIFLLALATGCRRGELWALDRNVQVVSRHPWLIQLRWHPAFVSKTHFTRKVVSRPKPIPVPAIQDEHLRNICPVHTLMEYLDLTAGLRRPEQRSLFLPVNPVTRDITKQSISFQIVKAVKLAYNFLDRSPPPGIKAHDVRGVAASLRAAAGASLEDIMDAGQWSSPSTFYRYYEKALTSGQVQTLQTIPVFVSARRCISSSSLSQEERSRQHRTGPEREWKGPTRPRQTGKEGSRPTLQAKATQRGVVAVDGISLRRSSQD